MGERKEILLRALRNETTSRPAWLPFVGCHGGKLIGRSAQDYLQSADLLVRGLKKANELYRPDGLPVIFDLQVEAEILGCQLHWAEEVPPSVTSHPLLTKELTDLPVLDATMGRIPLITQALDTLKTDMGDEIAFYGLICGPFTLALHLLGNEIFLEMYDHTDKVQAVIDYAADVAIKMAEIYLDHGADVIAVVDPMVSQISPEHFEEFVTPSVNRVFDAIRNMGGLSSMFVCGDVTRNLEVMCQTHADNVSVDEQIPLGRLRPLCEQYGKSFGGNIKLTTVLLLGDEEEAKLEAVHSIEEAGTKGFVLAPGCDLPYGTPPENLQAVAAMVHNEYQREVAKATAGNKQVETFDDIEVPDYDAHPHVVLDVITLDSTSCAPCQYMMAAVEEAAEATSCKVFVNEHKIKSRAGIGMMVKLGVENLPTICIDGEVAFASIIPDRKTLVEAIESHASKKVESLA